MLYVIALYTAFMVLPACHVRLYFSHQPDRRNNTMKTALLALALASTVAFAAAGTLERVTTMGNMIYCFYSNSTSIQLPAGQQCPATN